MSDPLTPEQRGLWRVFFTMRRQLELTLERRLQSDAGISNADYEVLIVLFDARDKRLRAGQIADLLGWEKSRVSHQVSRMTQRGLVRREECDDDARGIWVVLEPDGSRALLGSLRNRSEALREHFFDVLTEEELAVLERISSKVLDSINPPICDEVEAERGISA